MHKLITVLFISLFIVGLAPAPLHHEIGHGGSIAYYVFTAFLGFLLLCKLVRDTMRNHYAPAPLRKDSTAAGRVVLRVFL